MGLDIQYLREKDRMGTAGSLSLFKPDHDLPFLVMNGDVLTKVDFSSLKVKCFVEMTRFSIAENVAHLAQAALQLLLVYGSNSVVPL